MPESNRHLEHRTALYLILKREFAATATLGSDQFVYWDPTTAKKRLAPDAFVRLGTPHRTFSSWKTWERGAPDLAVEIVSDSDEAPAPWNEKLERYRAAGIGEVVRFDAEDREQPLRIWDAVDGDLVERAPDDPGLYACETLGLWWTIVEHPSLGRMLRLSRDREGKDLLLTLDEAEEKARAEEARARAEEARARAEEARARASEEEARAEEARARASEEEARAAEAEVRTANKQLQDENAALRAELEKAKGKPRKRR